MFLKSICLKNFKKFKDKEIKFPADLTVVRGPNEQGKSTIVQGLIAGLFYDATKRPKYAEELRAYNSKDLYRIELNFELDGQDFCLSKDFEKKTVSLDNKTSGEKENDPAKIKQWLWQSGGYGDENIFKAIACVEQSDLSAIGRKPQALSQMLEDLMTSGQSNVRAQDILVKLRKTYQDLTLGLGDRLVKNPGQIKKLADGMGQSQIELKDLQEKLAQKIQSQRQAQEIKTKVNILQKDLADQQALGQEIENYFNAKKNLVNLNIDFDRVAGLSDELASIQVKQKQVDALLENQPRIDEKNLAKFDELEYKKQVYQKELKRLSVIESPAQNSWGTEKLLFIVGGIISAIFLALGLLVNRWIMVGFVAGFLAVVWGLIKKLIQREPNKKEKVKTIRDHKAEVAKLLDKQDKILKLYNLQSRSDLEKVILQIVDLKNQAHDLDKHYQHLLGRQDLEQLKKQKQDLAKKIAVEESKISQHFQVEPPKSEQRIRLTRQIEDNKKQISRLEKELVRAQTEVSSNPADQEKINGLLESLEADKKLEQRLMDKKEAISLLGQVLQEARNLSLRASLGAIEKSMAQYIDLITDGRYTEVKLSPEDLSFLVFSPDKKEFIEPGELSHGTIDQLYFVARLAFLRAVSRASRPLVILDDPFVNIDNSRCVKISRILRELAQEFQIILLTCHERYDKWGKVVKL